MSVPLLRQHASYEIVFDSKLASLMQLKQEKKRARCRGLK